MTIQPVFATPPAAAPSIGRLLLVTYHFPPDNAVGARRWEKLIPFAVERGWAVDVITRELPITATNSARLRTLPPGVRVFHVPVETLTVERLESGLAAFVRRLRSQLHSQPRSPKHTVPAGASRSSATAVSVPAPAVAEESILRESITWSLSKPRGWLRLYWTWLDLARARAWGTRVVATANALTSANNARSNKSEYSVVISSGPPHLIHDTARRVAESLDVPFAMDMRDPWSCVERLEEALATPLWLKLADRNERRAIYRARYVFANTDVARDRLQAKYSARRSDIITVMNGVDDDPLPPAVKRNRFSIAHAGTIYLDRDPRPLFKAAAVVINELKLTPDQFGLDFIGEFSPTSGYPIQEVARQEGIENFVTVGPSLPYGKAMEFLAGATMLLTMSGGNIAAIPAKTFECIRFNAWVLALAMPGSATARLLEGTGADVVAPTDAKQMASVMRERYLEHAAGKNPTTIGTEDRFSRRYQASILLDAIATLCGTGATDEGSPVRVMETA